MGNQADGRMALFRKMDTVKKPAYVVEQILAGLQNGHLSSGDQLPTEQDIAVLTGVSRPSVREALGVLRYLGVLETRVGDGTYVKDLRNLPLALRASDILLESEEELSMAVEARRAIEMVLLEFAVLRRTPHQTKALAMIMGKMSRCVAEANVDGFLIGDRDFHSAIASATGNALLRELHGSLVALVDDKASWKDLVSLRLADQKELEQAYELHVPLLTAIEQQDMQGARASIAHHFDKLEQLVQSYSAQLSEEA